MHKNGGPDDARDSWKVMQGSHGLSPATVDVAESYDTEDMSETPVVLHGK